MRRLFKIDSLFTFSDLWHPHDKHETRQGLSLSQSVNLTLYRTKHAKLIIPSLHLLLITILRVYCMDNLLLLLRTLHCYDNCLLSAITTSRFDKLLFILVVLQSLVIQVY